jgi:hypothetical protein
MKNEQKFNIEVTLKAAEILKAQAQGATAYAVGEQAAALAVYVYERFAPDHDGGCDAYGCGATHTCEECGYESEEGAIANVERHSELVQDLYFTGAVLYAEGIYEKGYARLHDEYGHGAHNCLLDHIAQG